MLALTPLDGRYRERVASLVPYLSEFALVKHRLFVEVEWLLYLAAEIGRPIEPEKEASIRQLIGTFGEPQFEEFQAIEAQTKHDMKAVEIWLSSQLKALGLESYISLVHFGRTSEDINNLAYALMIKQASETVLIPAVETYAVLLKEWATDFAAMPMLSRTHGQPATPTTFGKECAVFARRLQQQVKRIRSVEPVGKLNGATGTFAADAIAFPDIDWPTKAQVFVEQLGLQYNPLTTQIESHDWIARLCSAYALAARISVDLARDMWQYISNGYITQHVDPAAVGSSTMPHKVNPIQFENAEANFGVARALLLHLNEKLPISRLQRDLSDSSTLRTLSEAFGHFLVATSSLQRGLVSVRPDGEAMLRDLQDQWMLLAEAVQTVMRKHGIADAYDQLKAVSRGKELDEHSMKQFIQDLNIPDDDKQRLLALTPATYVGYAEKLALL